MPDYFPWLLRGYILLLTFLLGACIGSFLDCSAGRYVRKVPYLKGRSHCDACGHGLDALDLIPVVSYLVRRGRCRHCGAKIPPRCLAVECLTGLVYLTTVWSLGLTLQSVEALILESLLVWLALVDLDTMELPNGPMLAGAVSWLCFLVSYPDPVHRLWWGLLGALCIGGGVLCVSLIADKALGRESMGGGDIKLLALLGLYLGPDGGLLLLIIACLAGLGSALLLKAGRGREFPFGPAIALAAWPCLLAGQRVLTWYFGLF